MTDLFNALAAWRSAGRRIALATIVDVWRSAPRGPGAAMAVNDRGEVFGSVSGGCVEGALYEEAQAVLRDGRPRLVRYGVADDEAIAVGLMCGGTIRLFVEPFDTLAGLIEPVQSAVRSGQSAATAVILTGEAAGARLAVVDDRVIGSTRDGGLDAALVEQARAMRRAGRSGVVRLRPESEGAGEDIEAFVQTFAPPARLHVFGAIDFARGLARLGTFLGYRVVVCDARPVFATRERFPEADEVVVAWPDEYLRGAAVGPRDAIVVLTHDPKFDVPALQAALDTEAVYIAALGSRSTHQRRREALMAAGVDEAGLGRIAAPAGLDLGGDTPEETALAIAAELVAVRNGRDGGRLRDRTGAIHAHGHALA
jgi:xanthine dehydrogenase accessory factor